MGSVNYRGPLYQSSGGQQRVKQHQRGIGYRHPHSTTARDLAIEHVLERQGGSFHRIPDSPIVSYAILDIVSVC